MNRISFLLTFLLSSFAAFGQSEPASSKSSYFFSLHTGLLLGGKGQGSSFTSSLIQGIRIKKSAFGIGLGYDALAEWRTLPVFATARFDFATVQERQFYLQMDGGYAKAWLWDIDESQVTFREKGGFFFHPQIGYRINADKVKVYLSVGYKVQRIEYEQTPNWGWGNTSSRYYITRDIERVSVQIGFGLF